MFHICKNKKMENYNTEIDLFLSLSYQGEFFNKFCGAYS